jgi:hypothetical protein
MSKYIYTYIYLNINKEISGQSGGTVEKEKGNSGTEIYCTKGHLCFSQLLHVLNTALSKSNQK